MARMKQSERRYSHRVELKAENPAQQALHDHLVELGKTGKASEWIIQACLLALEGKTVVVSSARKGGVHTVRQAIQRFQQHDEEPSYEPLDE